MCKGLAIIMDKKSKIYVDKISSHINLCNKYHLKKYDCLKYEIIMDDKLKQGYKVTIDSNYLINSNQGKEAKILLPKIKKYCKDNLCKIWQGLAHCQTYRESKGNQDHSSCDSKGNQDHSYCDSEGHQDHSWCKSKDYQDHSYCKSEGNQDHSCCDSEGSQDHSYCKSKGNQNHSYCKSEGEFYIGLIELTKYPNTTKILKMAKNSYSLQFHELIRYCCENHEQVLKNLGDE